MIKLVVIDFDDCLCQTEEACFHFENAVAGSLGLPPMTREVHRSNWGVPLAQAIPQRIPGVDSEEFMRQFAVLLPQYIANGTFDPITDGTLSTLRQLRRQQRTVCIFTARVKTEIKHLVAANHPLHGLIDHWYYQEYTEQVTGFHKPDPRALTGILTEFGVPAEQAVLVGDSPSDGSCANGANVPFIASMESGLRTRTDFAQLNVAQYIEHFAQLPEAIAQLE